MTLTWLPSMACCHSAAQSWIRVYLILKVFCRLEMEAAKCFLFLVFHTDTNPQVCHLWVLNIFYTSWYQNFFSSHWIKPLRFFFMFFFKLCFFKVFFFSLFIRHHLQWECSSSDAGNPAPICPKPHTQLYIQCNIKSQRFTMKWADVHCTLCRVKANTSQCNETMLLCFPNDAKCTTIV